jgi:ubiquitin carboxyl-terminal hydrolase 7
MLYHCETLTHTHTDHEHAMQRVFYRLFTSSDEVSTRELTRSFGWTSADAFEQVGDWGDTG